MRGRGKKGAFDFFFFFSPQDCKTTPICLSSLDCRYLKILYDDLVPRIRFEGKTHGSVQDERVSEASEPTRETPDYEGEQTGKGRGMNEDICAVERTWANCLSV